MEEADEEGSAFVTQGTFEVALSAAAAELHDQAMITLLRRYMALEGGSIAYSRFLEDLAKA